MNLKKKLTNLKMRFRMWKMLNFGSSKVFQLQMSVLFKRLSAWFRQKSLFLELDWAVKRRAILYIYPTTNLDRRIGKTYTLLQLAHKYNCPIAVANKQQGEMLNKSSLLQFNKPVDFVVCNMSIRGSKFDRMLVEEGVADTEEYRNLLTSSKSVVGFKNWD